MNFKDMQYELKSHELAHFQSKTHESSISEIIHMKYKQQIKTTLQLGK